MHGLFTLWLVALLGLPAHATDLTVSAAASLTNAFRDLAPMFEAANPGTKVLCNFGASGALLQQIDKGAPVDVFASADQETMDQAQSKGLVMAAQRRNVVSNTLVVIVPMAAANIPKVVADLTQAAYQRIAIGLPASVPVGRYTKGVLEAAGHWAAIEPKMVGANNVRQALDYVVRGEADAGFVYATDAAPEFALGAVDQRFHCIIVPKAAAIADEEGYDTDAGRELAAIFRKEQKSDRAWVVLSSASNNIHVMECRVVTLHVGGEA